MMLIASRIMFSERPFFLKIGGKNETENLSKCDENVGEG